MGELFLLLLLAVAYMLVSPFLIWSLYGRINVLERHDRFTEYERALDAQRAALKRLEARISSLEAAGAPARETPLAGVGALPPAVVAAAVPAVALAGPVPPAVPAAAPPVLPAGARDAERPAAAEAAQVPAGLSSVAPPAVPALEPPGAPRLRGLHRA
jgi:hypothetical protein